MLEIIKTNVSDDDKRDSVPNALSSDSLLIIICEFRRIRQRADARKNTARYLDKKRMRSGGAICVARTEEEFITWPKTSIEIEIYATYFFFTSTSCVSFIRSKKRFNCKKLALKWRDVAECFAVSSKI